MRALCGLMGSADKLDSTSPAGCCVGSEEFRVSSGEEIEIISRC